MDTRFSDAGLARVLEAVKARPKFTPGPWKVSAPDETAVVGADGWDVAATGHGRDYDEHYERMAADARLIAAAPDLLEALQTMVSRIEFYSAMGQAGQLNIEQWEYTDASSDMRKARAAIAKATGEES